MPKLLYEFLGCHWSVNDLKALKKVITRGLEETPSLNKRERLLIKACITQLEERVRK